MVNRLVSVNDAFQLPAAVQGVLNAITDGRIEAAGGVGGGGSGGSHWFSGAITPGSGLGIVGDWYINSSSGAFYEKTGSGIWTQRGNLVGPAGTSGSPGTAGTAGSKWYSGAGAPGAGTGVVGDWYLNTTDGSAYEKTGSAVWTLRDNLTGPPGTVSLTSPAFTGTPTAPTALTSTNNTQLATTAFVHNLGDTKQSLIWVGDTPPTDTATYPLWLQTFVTPSDTTPPTAATLAAGSLDASNHVVLSWSGSTDASGVSYYQLFRSVGAGSTPALYQNRVDGTSYIDTSVAASTVYRYQVKPVDVFGNIGALSNIISVTTGAASLLTDPDLRFLFLTDTALGSAADGSSVASLVPQYGTLVGGLTLSQATGANQPTVLAAQLNGKKVVKHVAASLQFIGGLLPTTITAATTEFMVARITPVSAVRLLVSGVNTTPYRGIGINASNKPTANSGGTPGNVAGPTTNTDVWKVWAVRIDPSTGATALFDNKLTTPATGALSTDTSVNAMNSVKVGRASGSSSSYSDMQWAALGVVERAMSDADISAAMTQLGTLFGITVAA